MADPIATREQKTTALNLSSDEKRLFSQVFEAADREGLGVVTGDIALSFFPQRTKLPVDVLGEIWQIADTEDKGFLTPNGFYIVLRLIGYAQAGRPVNAEAAVKAGPLPRFEGINGLGSISAPSAPATLQPQTSGGPIRVPPLLAEKASQYASLFEESGAQNGLLPGATAKQIFDRAQLPNDVLVRIWNLADTEMRGMLSCTEFIIAMHLLASFRSGSMRALPQSLPAGLYEAASRRGAPARPATASRPGPGSPHLPAVSRQMTGSLARTASPTAAQQAYVVPPMPVQLANQRNAPAADDWIITITEKAKYDAQFSKLDTSSKGFVSGDEAVDFFSKSGLAENDLAQIWDLADIRSEGKLNRDEFAVAMYLIVQNVQSKMPIPSALPTTLIPPSMRQAASFSQKSTAPDFQQPQAAAAPKQAKSAADDLFGLDALSASPTPALTPAAPQVAQSTGGSSSLANAPAPKTSGLSPSVKATNASTMFKSFQPSSSFGQSIATSQQNGIGADIQSNNSRAMSDDLLGDTDEASKSIAGDSVDIGNLSNQASSLSSQVADAKTKRSAAEQSMTQASEQKRFLEAQLAQLRKDYEQEVRDVRLIEDRSENLRVESNKLQQDLVLLQHTQHNLTEQHQKIAQQLAADQQENQRLKDQINQGNSEINQLKPQLEKAKSDARQQKGLVAINKKQLATVEAERDRLKEELAAVTKDHGDASQELAAIQAKVETASQEHEARSKDLNDTRGSLEAIMKQRGDLSTQSEVADSTPVINPITSSVASPAASINSMNPFFKHSTSNQSVERVASMSPAAEAARSVNHSAFDEFFGRSADPSDIARVPQAAFGALTSGSDSWSNATPDSSRMVETSAGAAGEQRPKIPPSPPRSRQISSSTSAAKEPAKEVVSASSTQAAATANVTNGLPIFVAPTELYNASSQHSDASRSAAAKEEEYGQGEKDEHVTTDLGQSSDLPGTFPDETPIQTPLHTGSSSMIGSESFRRKDEDDPFSGVPTKSKSVDDDFESAFAGFKDDGTNANEIDPTATAATGQEFPPIEHYENDESDSDSGTGFEDNFAPSSTMHQGTKRQDTKPSQGSSTHLSDATGPGPFASSSATGENGIHAGSANDQHEGSLPAAEDISFRPLPEPRAQQAGFPMPSPGEKKAAEAPLATQSVANNFDSFDDDFKDLSETRVADEMGGVEDFAASVASRRETLDEFNPTFDSFEPSLPHPGITSSSTASHAKSNAGPAFDFGLVSNAAGSVLSTSAKNASSQGASTHDWDAIFTGLQDSSASAQAEGTSALDEAFGPDLGRVGPSNEKPSLARAISNGTEHDDPILKSLTGMGFSREESLKALEKYDYNINKAADYLTSKP